jgi:hypothetical protein
MKLTMLVVLLITLLITKAANHTLVKAQMIGTPLTKEELIDLCQRPYFRKNPDRVMEDWVKRNKIAFLPTKKTIAYLESNGVPLEITGQLKNFFASRISYRVCKFEPKEGVGGNFSRRLLRQMEMARIKLRNSPGDFLYEKGFDPTIAEPNGPTQQELNQNPLVGYVIIMGDVERTEANSGKITITARLAYVSRLHQRDVITAPLIVETTLSDSEQNSAAKKIAEWSIRAVEDAVK